MRGSITNTTTKKIDIEELGISIGAGQVIGIEDSEPLWRYQRAASSLATAISQGDILVTDKYGYDVPTEEVSDWVDNEWKTRTVAVYTHQFSIKDTVIPVNGSSWMCTDGIPHNVIGFPVPHRSIVVGATLQADAVNDSGVYTARLHADPSNRGEGAKLLTPLVVFKRDTHRALNNDLNINLSQGEYGIDFTQVAGEATSTFQNSILTLFLKLVAI